MSARALPDVDHPDFAPFWAGCAEGRLLVPTCGNRHTFWPPRPACPECAEWVAEWTEVRGSGRLYSWTVVHRTRQPWFADRTPYVVGIVTLDPDHTIRMVGRCEIDPAVARDGLHLQVGFEDAGHRVHLPYWREAPVPAGVDRE